MQLSRPPVPAAQQVDVSVSCVGTGNSNCSGAPVPDPDFVLYHGRSVRIYDSDDAGVEHAASMDVEAGQHVLEIYD